MNCPVLVQCLLPVSGRVEVLSFFVVLHLTVALFLVLLVLVILLCECCRPLWMNVTQG